MFNVDKWKSIINWLQETQHQAEETFKNSKHTSKITLKLESVKEVCINYMFYYKENGKTYENIKTRVISRDEVPKDILEYLEADGEYDFTDKLKDSINAGTGKFEIAKLNDVDMSRYTDNYSENAFWKKFKGLIKTAGVGLLYNALQLFYVAQRPDCPKRVKLAILAVLGYFITPFDVVPDFLPLAGLTDDAGAFILALAQAKFYINDDIRQQAKNTISSFFGEDVVAKLN